MFYTVERFAFPCLRLFHPLNYPDDPTTPPSKLLMTVTRVTRVKQGAHIAHFRHAVHT